MRSTSYYPRSSIKLARIGVTESEKQSKRIGGRMVKRVCVSMGAPWERAGRRVEVEAAAAAAILDSWSCDCLTAGRRW